MSFKLFCCLAYSSQQMDITVIHKLCRMLFEASH